VHPVVDDLRDPRGWMRPFGLVTLAGVLAGTVAAGLPAGPAGVAFVVLIAVAAVLWVVGLLPRGADLRLVVPALTGVGLAGAGADLVVGSRGPAFVLGYMGLTGLALRAPRCLALACGLPVLAALAVAEGRGSADPGSSVLSVALGAGFLFVASSLAAAQADAREQVEQRLLEQTALAAAREEAAALAERTRLARELHDVLAHSLAGLSVQLEATRLLATTTGADPALVEQVTRAQHLARDGMAGARRAVSALRGEQLPGPDQLPALVADHRAATGMPAQLTVDGAPRPLATEAGLAVYRAVQEALTNAAKYAGRGAEVEVVVDWSVAGEITVRVSDAGGDGVPAGLPSGGFGLSGLAERAALLGGRASSGPLGGEHGGFAVELRLPLDPAGAREVPG